MVRLIMLVFVCLSTVAVSQDYYLNAYDYDGKSNPWTDRGGYMGMVGDHVWYTYEPLWWDNFPGPTGTYRIVVDAGIECDGAPSYGVEVNGSRVCSGQFPDGGDGCDDCGVDQRDVHCTDNATIPNGATIAFLGSSVYTCGEHGAYSRFKGLKLTLVGSSSCDDAPNISSDPQDADVQEGASATFSVDASGCGDLSYEWLRNGSSVGGAPNSDTYTIDNTSSSDDGARISCRVSNEAGSNTSGEATLTVTPLVVRDPDNPGNTEQGIAYEYFEGSGWSSLPDFNSETPVSSGTCSQINLDGVSHADDNFAIRYFGFIEIPTANPYTFSVDSDDGSQIYIGDQLVVDNNEPTWEYQVERSGTIGLAAGKHQITVLFHEGGGGEYVNVWWQAPGIDKAEIPSSALFYSPDAVAAASPTGGLGQGNPGVVLSSSAIRILPQSSDYTVRVFDTRGSILLKRSGTGTATLNLGELLPAGNYLVTAQIAGRVFSATIPVVK